jgi:hypothetical protein
MSLSEDLLQFIWKHRLFNQNNLQTFSGKKLQINKPGNHNVHAGPDFEAASLRINNIDWFGNVEVHIASSDWETHNHQNDKAYNNVVLHVVYHYDSEVQRADGTIPETLVLKPLIKESILLNYRDIMTNMHWIPCERLIGEVDRFYINHWLSGVLVERLIQKSAYVFHLLDQYQGNWEEVCYIISARSFGFKTNSDAFEMLARSLPQGLISKNRNNKLTIEALLFGQSGLLEDLDIEEDYPMLLKKEYDYLKELYSLKKMDKHIWRFLRMRPAGFPSMRIAQFAAFCHSNDHLFSRIIEVEDLTLHDKWLSNLPVNDFWRSYYHFNNKSKKLHGNQLGQQAKHSILLNVISVVLFAYGQFIGNEKYVNRAVELLEGLSSEKNQVIRQFEELGIKCENAAQSQALIQLKTIYCDEKRCLDCEIGLQIIKSE